MKYGELNLGQVEAIVNKLGGMKGVQRFLAGDSEVIIKNHIINCDAYPFVPDRWKVQEHQKGGNLKWNASQVVRHLGDDQKNDKIKGSELRKKLAGKPVLNACVLDYLLANPHLIPEEWKIKSVFFWGTIYYNSHDVLCVRYLFWNGCQWNWGFRWLGVDWDNNDPAATRKLALV